MFHHQNMTWDCALSFLHVLQVLNAGGVADVTGPAAGVHWGSCLGLDDWVSPGRLQELQLLL
jgi:hypothetical protein